MEEEKNVNKVTEQRLNDPVPVGIADLTISHAPSLSSDRQQPSEDEGILVSGGKTTSTQPSGKCGEAEKDRPQEILSLTQPSEPGDNSGSDSESSVIGIKLHF